MKKDLVLNLALAASVVLAFISSVSVGSNQIPLLDVYRLFTGTGTDIIRLVLLEIRLPRAILAGFVGATLGLVGAVMQGFLRNPLAEPGLIGISASAALGSVLVFYSGMAGLMPMALPLGGIAGALVAAIIIHILARNDNSILTLILAGIALNSLAGALTALALSLAPSPYAALEVVFWLLGSLVDRGFNHVALAVPLILVGWLFFVGTGRGLDALSIGEDTALRLGVNVSRLRFQLIFGAALAVGSAVAVTGVVGFVGLMVPHILRPMVDNQPSRLLLPSALGGAVLLLVADLAARLASTGAEIRLGVVTAILGAPFFFILIFKSRRKMI